MLDQQKIIDAALKIREQRKACDNEVLKMWHEGKLDGMILVVDMFDGDLAEKLLAIRENA